MRAQILVQDPLRKYRRRFRSWREEKRLQKENEYYASLFESLKLTLPDDASIQETIRKRYEKVRPKAKGSLTLLAIYRNYNWENECLKPALEKFGGVDHYDWSPRYSVGKDWHRSVKREMNLDLIRWVEKRFKVATVDAIFTYVSGENVSQETVQQLRAFGVPMINLSLNDKEAFVGRMRAGRAGGVRDICRFFDISWTSTQDSLEKYCVEGALPIYLPEGANPEVHRPYSEETKTIDVSFVGQCYGKRPEIIEKLRTSGIRVDAYGYGWPGGPVPTGEMVRIYSKSKINLGFGGVADYEDRYCLKGRDFEIPMSGGMYLTQYNPELERFYDLRTEIVTYKDFQELLSKIRELLHSPERAEAIRQQGYRRAHRDHSWEMRFDRIFKLARLI